MFWKQSISNKCPCSVSIRCFLFTEILAADPQLAEEIKFDLRRFEEEQKRAAKPATPVGVITPHGQMISPLLSPGVLGSPARGGTPVLTPPKLRNETPASRGATALAAKSKCLLV